MRIGLINEDSQIDKNPIMYEILNDEATKKGHEVLNFGMFSENGYPKINYTQVGIVASILLELNVVDFIVTGCGTGQGASMSCNAFSNVTCGYVAVPLDAYLVTQVNAANAISVPLAQGFGWGAEVNLRKCFQTLFEQDFGGGYPDIYKESQGISRKNMYTNVKYKSSYPVIDAMKRMDHEYLKDLINYPEFMDGVEKYGTPCDLKEYILSFKN